VFEAEIKGQVVSQSFLLLVAVLRSSIQALQLCRARVMAASPTCAFSSSSVMVSSRGGEEEEGRR